MKKIINCNNCGYKKIVNNIDDFKEVKTCSKCGKKNKTYKCPECGMYAKLFIFK